MDSRAIKQALAQLTDGGAGVSLLRPAPAVGARPGAVSTGRPSASTAGAGGGTVFAEKDAAQREYYASRVLVSSDGIFQVDWHPIKSLLLEGDVRATFKDPP